VFRAGLAGGRGTRGTGRITVGALAALALLGAAGCAGGAPAPSAASGSGRPASLGASEQAEPAAGTSRDQDRIVDCDAPALIAHRGEVGDGRNLPENTWQAELDAAAEGVTYLNMDVRWTIDGVPVALHDATVDRTTSETRPDTPITALTAADYTALTSRGYAGDTGRGPLDPGVHPDTLAEVLAKVSGTGKPIVLQMEADPLDPAQAGGTPQQDLTDLAQVIDSSGYADRVIVAGWTLRDLAALHAVAPQLTLAYLFETIGAKQYPTAGELLAAGARIVYADYRGIDARWTASWHRGGLKVWAWTPATRAAWQALTTDGVDAIATNWSAFYLAWESHPCSAASAV
jgi:glycerophosphoryl diester phosphodiesterase